LLGLGLWLVTLVLRDTRTRRLRGQLHVYDARIEDVDEVAELQNVLVDALYVEILMPLRLWQRLERKEVFEDDAARLEQIVREALLTVSRLLHTVAARVAEACVEPAAYHEVSKHVDLIATKLGLPTRLVLGGLAGLIRVRRVGHALRLHD